MYSNGNSENRDTTAAASSSQHHNVGPSGDSVTTTISEDSLLALFGGWRLDSMDVEDVNKQALENPASDDNENSEDTSTTTRNIKDNFKGFLELTGEDKVIVHGNVTGVIFHKGSGRLIIYGNIKGKLLHKGTGRIVIFGNVTGCIEQSGGGAIFIHGNVRANIQQDGSGTIEVLGAHVCGNVRKGGEMNGTIKITG